MALEKHIQQQGRVLYHYDAELIGNRKKIRQLLLISDLKYADDTALVADSWEDYCQYCSLYRRSVKSWASLLI